MSDNYLKDLFINEAKVSLTAPTRYGGEWKPIGDGNTHLWISLLEGRTSPMLGVCPNGTVTVDWGDGTTPDVLTGTSIYTIKWTPTHHYAKPGDYIITLTVDGEMVIKGSGGTSAGSYLLRHSSGNDGRNIPYLSALKKVEIGHGVTTIGGSAFYNCHRLTNVAIPDGVTTIGEDIFYNCYSLTNVAIPDGVTTIGGSAFFGCHSLTNVAIHDDVTTIGPGAFYNCHSLTNVAIPDGVTTIGNKTFFGCYSLTNVAIPDGVTTIGNQTFYICYGLAYVDFTRHTAVPTLSSTNAFSDTPDDCEMRVPAALVEEWKSATNWSTYADYIVGV